MGAQWPETPVRKSHVEPASILYSTFSGTLCGAQKIAMLDYFGSVDAESEFVRGAIFVAK